jgi:hypothetical protein
MRLPSKRRRRGHAFPRNLRERRGAASGRAAADRGGISGADRNRRGHRRVSPRCPPETRRRAHSGFDVSGPLRHVVRAFRQRPCGPGVVERARHPSRRNPAGALRPATGLSLRITGCVRSLFGECVTRGVAGGPRDRSRLPPGAGRARPSGTPARSRTADQRLFLPGPVRMAPREGAGLAHVRGVAAGRRVASTRPRESVARILRRIRVSGMGSIRYRRRIQNPGPCRGQPSGMGGGGRRSRTRDGDFILARELLETLELGAGRGAGAAGRRPIGIHPAGRPAQAGSDISATIWTR